MSDGTMESSSSTDQIAVPMRKTGEELYLRGTPFDKLTASLKLPAEGIRSSALPVHGSSPFDASSARGWPWFMSRCMVSCSQPRASAASWVK